MTSKGIVGKRPTYRQPQLSPHFAQKSEVIRKTQ